MEGIRSVYHVIATLNRYYDATYDRRCIFDALNVAFTLVMAFVGSDDAMKNAAR